MNLTRLHRHRQETRALVDYQHDSTDALRALHPDLRNVWDELDELRETVDDMDESFEHWQPLAEQCGADIDGLIADCEMSEKLQVQLERIADLLDGRAVT